MRVVLGIGNPGARYEGTRHSVGFEVVDLVAARYGAAFQRRGFSAVAATLPGGGVLLKPLTYVNRSGDVLIGLREEVGFEPADLLVVVDDVNLPPGRLRLRGQGSDGGHNGLKDIARALGTSAYPRMRIGIGPAAGGDLREHVLTRFAPEEALLVGAALDHAAAAAAEFLDGAPLARLMEVYNRVGPAGAAGKPEQEE